MSLLTWGWRRSWPWGAAWVQTQQPTTTIRPKQWTGEWRLCCVSMMRCCFVCSSAGIRARMMTGQYFYGEGRGGGHHPLGPLSHALRPVLLLNWVKGRPIQGWGTPPRRLCTPPWSQQCWGLFAKTGLNMNISRMGLPDCESYQRHICI